MLLAVIDNGSTWLYDISDNPEIRLDVFSDEMKERYFGWIVNTDSISKMIIKLPISRFALKDQKNGLIEIKMEDAISWYEILATHRENKKRSRMIQS